MYVDEKWSGWGDSGNEEDSGRDDKRIMNKTQ